MRKMFFEKAMLIVAAVAASALSSSCIHKTLVYDARHLAKVVVDIDWTLSPNEHSGSHVAFYDLQNEDSFYYFDMAAEGGEIEIPSGDYQVVCFNNDSETILFRNESSLDTYEAYTRLSALHETSFAAGADLPRSEADSDQDVILCPTNFYSDFNEAAYIKENQVNYVFFKPDSAILTYTYEVINIENLKLVNKTGAALSGVSGSNMIGGGSVSATQCVIPLESGVDGSKITGSFTLFGHSSELKNKHLFTLYIWSMGGNFYATFDVTEQMDNHPDQKHVHLVIDASGIYIPEPIGDGGGIAPSVGEWEDVNEDIIL